MFSSFAFVYAVLIVQAVPLLPLHLFLLIALSRMDVAVVYISNCALTSHHSAKKKTEVILEAIEVC